MWMEKEIKDLFNKQFKRIYYSIYHLATEVILNGLKPSFFNYP